MSSAFSYKPGKIVNSLKSTVKIFNEDKSVEVIALWDTGATLCCISENVVEQLSLVATGRQESARRRVKVNHWTRI